MGKASNEHSSKSNGVFNGLVFVWILSYGLQKFQKVDKCHRYWLIASRDDIYRDEDDGGLTKTHINMDESF